MCVLARLGNEYDSVDTNINSMKESSSLSEVYSILLSQENRTEQNLGLWVVKVNYAQIRNRRRNWNKHDKAGNQYQPCIVFRNPRSDSKNGQRNQNLKIKEKAKLCLLMMAQIQSGHVKSTGK